MSKNLPQPDLKGVMISHQQLTALCGYNEQTFRTTLADANYIPKPVRGQYPLLPTLAGIFRYMREQAAKTNRKEREDAKDKKAILEVEALQRTKDYEEGRTLTVDEWNHLGAEFFPPLVNIVQVLFNIEIPANCSGMPEAAIRVWCKKKENSIRRTLRDTEKEFEPGRVVDARKTAKGK